MSKSVKDLMAMKAARTPITVVTAYDFPTARILDECGVDVILVGDSVGDTVLGYKSIRDVTMADMLHHTAAAARGSKNAFVIGDMPYRSYSTPARALANARKLIACGAVAVKMEGGVKLVPVIRTLRKHRIAVCGHLGYLPQSAAKPGAVGKTLPEAKRLVEDALAIEEAGAFMTVIELIPARLARALTRLLRIPTIGIGAGPHCDGQVQVFHDMAGLSPVVYRHVKVFAHGKETLAAGAAKYAKEVREKKFPTERNAPSMDEEVAAELERWVSGLERSTPVT